ncbi:export-related chaperone protein CsaA [Actinopolyspora mzabensis]|uniref:Export-related chaperone protein CsaA n=1 Tax=Actinopolyspora mzabensis TaxID=995066 RepID=A0A1G8Y8M0_ACTMZ|nr:export-related chaperone protein CsaA [Actinopolyspora mzabensis]
MGTVVTAEPNAAARNPCYVLSVDLGEHGVRTSSAQITEYCMPEDLLGRQVLCVCNFEPGRVAGMKSEVLVTGARDDHGGVVLAGFQFPVPNGHRLVRGGSRGLFGKHEPRILLRRHHRRRWNILSRSSVMFPRRHVEVTCAPADTLCAHSGVSLGPVLGEIAAQEVLGTPHPLAEPFRPARF